MEDLKITFLKDLEENCVDGVIISTKSTVEDIQEAIDNVKAEVELYDWTDIEGALPDDCKLLWVNNGEVVDY